MKKNDFIEQFIKPEWVHKSVMSIPVSARRFKVRLLTNS